MNPAQLSFPATDLAPAADLVTNLAPSLATRRLSRAEAEHERREEIREHARQRLMVQESIMRHAVRGIKHS